MSIERWSQRVYRALLRLYPAPFRDEYGAEMDRVFEDRLEDVRRPAAFFTLWCDIMTDLALTAPREHLDELRQDIRYVLRTLRRAPGFAAAVIATLALGIGGNTAIFSIVSAVMLDPLPFPEPGRLVRLWEKNESLGIPRFSLSVPNYVSFGERARSFEVMGALGGGSVNLTSAGEPIRLPRARVTASLFDVLGIRPVLGRTFTADEDRPGGPRVAMISEGLWRRRFGADRAIVGQTIALDGEAAVVVGVYSSSVRVMNRADIWTPMAFNLAEENRGNHVILVVGRLKRDVTIVQAQRELDTIAAALGREFPPSNGGWSVDTASLYDWLVPPATRQTLTTLLAAVGLVLLAACANVANLLLARAAVRHREVVLRVALGASRARLVRQFLTESLVLASIGGVIGVLMAYGSTSGLKALLPATLPRTEGVGVNGTVLLFSVAATLVTGVAFGLLPAWNAARSDVNASLKDLGRGPVGSARHGARAALVVVEVAMATVLLVGASLLVQTLRNLQRVDLGFTSEHVLTASLGLPGSRYPSPVEGRAFYDRLLGDLSAAPGVRAAGATSLAPYAGGNTGQPVSAAGPSRLAAGEQLQADWRVVSAEYFRALDIPVRRGRAFTAADTSSAPPSMIVSESMARRIWGGDDPVGREVKLSRGSLRIVGVVGDVRGLDLALAPRPTMYFAMSQSWWSTFDLVIRTEQDPAALAAVLRDRVRQIDGQLAVFNVRTLDSMLDTSAAQPRLNAWLLALFAGLALLLGAIGIYGVLSYLVARRTQEIGVRMAMGATPRDVLRLVVRHGLALGAIGVAAGLVLAWALASQLTDMLFGVQPRDPATLAAVAGTLLMLVLASCYLPARRATHVDPIVALRCE